MGFIRKKDLADRMGEQLEEREFRVRFNKQFVGNVFDLIGYTPLQFVITNKGYRSHANMLGTTRDKNTLMYKSMDLYRPVETPDPFIDKASKIPPVPKWRIYAE